MTLFTLSLIGFDLSFFHKVFSDNWLWEAGAPIHHCGGNCLGSCSELHSCNEIMASECVWHFVFHLMHGCVRIMWAVNNGDETVSEMMDYELLSLWLIVQEDLILFSCHRTC